MTDRNVLNYFKTTDVAGGAAGNNPLEIGGTMDVLSGGTVNFNAGSTVNQNGATTGGNALNKRYIDINMANISAAAGTVYVNCPYAGTITKIIGCLGHAVTVASANITSAIGGVAITGGGFPVATTHAAGDVMSATPSAANVVAAGNTVSISTDGGSTTTAAMNFQIEVTLS